MEKLKMGSILLLELLMSAINADYVYLVILRILCG